MLEENQKANVLSKASIQHAEDATLCLAAAPVLQLMGMVFESLKQPVINGYLVAGAIVGPGGLQLIKELVQVSCYCRFINIPCYVISFHYMLCYVMT